tara:strand:+ start:64 stop:231 length:168 start_codon:yes stop_codon:yes gene_type:complete
MLVRAVTVTEDALKQINTFVNKSVDFSEEKVLNVLTLYVVAELDRVALLEFVLME